MLFAYVVAIRQRYTALITSLRNDRIFFLQCDDVSLDCISRDSKFVCKISYCFISLWLHRKVGMVQLLHNSSIFFSTLSIFSCAGIAYVSPIRLNFSNWWRVAVHGNDFEQNKNSIQNHQYDKIWWICMLCRILFPVHNAPDPESS